MAAEPARRPSLSPLSSRPRAPRELPEYLPARMLNEFVYCPRLFFYEWVEGTFAPSEDTLAGKLRHEKLETREDPLPPPGLAEPIHSRSVMLASQTHRLIARLDLLEGDGNAVTPVDYKKGRPREEPDGPAAWPADRVQIGAQALILRDNGYRCEEAIVYYDETRQRVRLPVDAALVEETLAALHGAIELAERGPLPPPLVDSPKCPRCSLVGICLPDETASWAHATADEAGPQLSLFEPVEPVTIANAQPLRRLVPARDDLRPLYVSGYGLTMGKSGEVLQIRDRAKGVQEVRIGELSQVNLIGNITLTGAAVQGLCEAEKPIAYFSSGGWFYGLTQGLGLKNVFLRQRQFALAAQPLFCLDIARRVTVTKIRNQRTMLRRNHLEPPALALTLLRRCAQAAAAAPDLPALLGIEGTAARHYFGAFSGMIKVEDEQAAPFGFDFNHRNRRPPRDRVNALLSFAYSLLTKDLTIVCHAVGFDPFIGFFHQLRFGRPALALDLLEEFRPLIADSAVLSAINTGMVDAGDFIEVGPAVALTPRGRKAFLRAYEQRMDTLVTHPLFGYRVNYRRVLEMQARLLARVIEGEVGTYQGFETR
ncbi:MAG TPA: CRISPR-associated endonuclease Cas1 [Candidatus Binataceae bacterium]|nr:CRISPR-associated endonuclease Cas1 [Candidatus Binataceae bacterium]